MPGVEGGLVANRRARTWDPCLVRVVIGTESFGAGLILGRWQFEGEMGVEGRVWEDGRCKMGEWFFQGRGKWWSL